MCVEFDDVPTPQWAIDIQVGFWRMCLKSDLKHICGTVKFICVGVFPSKPAKV